VSVTTCGRGVPAPFRVCRPARHDSGSARRRPCPGHAATNAGRSVPPSHGRRAGGAYGGRTGRPRGPNRAARPAFGGGRGHRWSRPPHELRRPPDRPASTPRGLSATLTPSHPVSAARRTPGGGYPVPRPALAAPSTIVRHTLARASRSLVGRRQRRSGRWCTRTCDRPPPQEGVLPVAATTMPTSAERAIDTSGARRRAWGQGIDTRRARASSSVPTAEVHAPLSNHGVPRRTHGLLSERPVSPLVCARRSHGTPVRAVAAIESLLRPPFPSRTHR